MILLIDSYDSFVHNLAGYLRELGEEVEVVRNDAVDVEGIRARAPSHLVLSPGPGTPATAGVCVAAVRALGASLPTLGVCLGHQCVAEAYGGRVVRGTPMHGKLSPVRHDGRGLFHGLPNPLRVTRYHSLLVDPGSLHGGPRNGADPDGGPPSGGSVEVRRGPLRVTARTEAGEVMALEHVEHPVWGVQFHPEAVLTEGGHALLANFLTLDRENR